MGALLFFSPYQRREGRKTVFANGVHFGRLPAAWAIIARLRYWLFLFLLQSAELAVVMPFWLGYEFY